MTKVRKTRQKCEKTRKRRKRRKRTCKIAKRPPMAKIDQTGLLVDINGLFEGVIWRPSKSKKSWPGVGKERGEKEKQNFRKI